MDSKSFRICSTACLLFALSSPFTFSATNANGFFASTNLKNSLYKFPLDPFKPGLFQIIEKSWQGNPSDHHQQQQRTCGRIARSEPTANAKMRGVIWSGPWLITWRLEGPAVRCCRPLRRWRGQQTNQDRNLLRHQDRRSEGVTRIWYESHYP